jgi:hypothetical protein
MSQMEHDRIEELIAARALGGLDGRDVAELDRLRTDHGGDCATCLALEDDYAEVAGRLSFAADPSSIPAGFEDRVVASATAEGGSGRGVPFGLKRFVAASAAAVLLAGAGLGGWLLRSPGSPNVRVAQVAALHGSGPGNVALAYAPASARWFLVGSNLPDAPNGKVYELWLFHGKTPAPAGTFRPRDGVALLDVPSDVTGASLAAITIEAAPGAEQPTTAPIFSGSV